MVKKKCVKVDCVIVAVVHYESGMMTPADVKKFTNDNLVIVDLRRIAEEEFLRLLK